MLSALRRSDKYGDFDGYTSDDPILKLEILSRRFATYRAVVLLRSCSICQRKEQANYEISRQVRFFLKMNILMINEGQAKIGEETSFQFGCLCIQPNAQLKLIPMSDWLLRKVVMSPQIGTSHTVRMHFVVVLL
ncbi:hypothetical protein Tco_1074567, partial [Tanacetum coccineum]